VARSRRRFGLDPSELSDAEKAGRLAAIEKVYEQLKRNQDVNQVRTRRNRVTFAGEMRYPEASKFLRRVLSEDRDLRTRVAALIAIGQSGEFATIEDATRAAIAAAKKESVFVLSIPRMFAECRHPDAGAFLLSRLSSVKDEASIAAIVEGIGITREPTAVEALQELATKSKYVTVRFEALRALGGCGGKNAVALLSPYLADEDWRIRMAAAEGLGRTGERAVIPQLAELLVETEAPIVIETAAEALGALGGTTAVEPLIQVLWVGRLRGATRRGAARVLGRHLHGGGHDARGRRPAALAQRAQHRPRIANRG
jgi:HEAT repeat protein